jgi:hypothetical protein
VFVIVFLGLRDRESDERREMRRARLRGGGGGGITHHEFEDQRNVPIGRFDSKLKSDF